MNRWFYPYKSVYIKLQTPLPFLIGYFEVGSVVIQLARDNIVILRHDKRGLDIGFGKLIELG